MVLLLEEPLEVVDPLEELLEPEAELLLETVGIGSQAGNRTITLYTLSGSCWAASSTEVKFCSGADWAARIGKHN